MPREYDGLKLTDSFHDDERAVKVLKHYYRQLSGKNKGFTGSVWDTFDPEGIRESTTDTFTAQDLIACALLSTPIPGRAAHEILGHQREDFETLLRAIGKDRPFVDESDPSRFNFDPVFDLYQALKALPGVGPTRATKLIARKRPQLVPIIDGVIVRTIFNPSGNRWEPLHTALSRDGCALWKKLKDLKERAELPNAVPVVRVFDVLAWMDGTGKFERALKA